MGTFSSASMNVELLESVRHSILVAPERFCAAQWAFARNGERVLREGAPPKEFRCCIAGHVLLRSGVLDERQLLKAGGFHTGGRLWEQATAVVDLDEDQGRELFFPSQWDSPYKHKYYHCTPAAEAEVAAAYLHHFIEKYEGDAPSTVRTERSARSRTSPLGPRESRCPHKIGSGSQGSV